ncbi:MAG: UDP-N-acetylmuramoyl-tripeptide--D-alanyl-D-alanine ligase [Dehalococcoidia bacterium]|nr:UDP-N-acetylmuramoyl-tripeptide--D-alanyl-D-alanine ligase [Dehalococcoidia bacterium]
MSNKLQLNNKFITDALKDILIEASDTNQVFNKIKIHSKDIKNNDLFIAMQGSNENGSKYINEAIKNGAKGIITSQNNKIDNNIAKYYVKDCNLALQKMAKIWRAQFKDLDVVGITGSVGKTTTKQISSALLQSRFETLGSKKNYNNEIGLPLTIFDINHNTEIAVLEMGMYKRGDINLLTKISMPNIGVITNIESIHVERAGSEQNIFLAKQELIEALPSDGIAILNIDDKQIAKMQNIFPGKIITFGIEKSADISAKNIDSNGLNGFSFELLINHKSAGKFRTLQPGVHLLPCFLASIALAHKFEIRIKDMQEVISKFKLDSRLQILKLDNDITIIDDSYNSGPSALKGALNLLKDSKNYKVAILGDMNELGKLSNQLHLEIGTLVTTDIDEVICLGKQSSIIFHKIKNNALIKSKHFLDIEELNAYLSIQNYKNSTILIKGSRTLKMENIVQKFIQLNSMRD